MRTQNDPPGVSFPYRLFLSTTTGSSQIADTWRVPTPPSSAALGTKRAVSHNVAPDLAASVILFLVARAPLRLRSGQALARERRRLLPKCSPITRSSNLCHSEPSFIGEQCAFSAIAWPEPEYAAPGSLTSRCTCSGITT